MSNPNFSHKAIHQQHLAQHKHAVQTAHRADAQFRDSARRHREQAVQASRHQHKVAHQHFKDAREIRPSGSVPEHDLLIKFILGLVGFGALAAWALSAG